MNTTQDSHEAETIDPNNRALIEDMSRLVRKALATAITRLGGDERSDRAALTVERAHRPVAPARLASVHPGGGLAQQLARQLYERCLQHYRKVVRACDADRSVDDVGAAVACFVAANFQALRGEQATPQMLLKLERQLSGVVQASAAWADASAAERQFYFEQMAILAVLIGESSAQAPRQGEAAIANVQRAARGYLHDLLGLDPDLLRVGPDGLQLAGAAA